MNVVLKWRRGKREFTPIQLTGQLTAPCSVFAFNCYVWNVFREQTLIFFSLKTEHIRLTVIYLTKEKVCIQDYFAPFTGNRHKKSTNDGVNLNSRDVCFWIDAGAPADQAAVSKVMGGCFGYCSCSESAAVVGYC